MLPFKVVSFFLLGHVIALICFTVLGYSDAQLLPQDEVGVLQTISNKLQNLNWKVTQRSCSSTNGGFNNKIIIPKAIVCDVTCDCSFESATVCHVTHILLKGLNLTGVLPAEFGNLTHLQELDLTRNYINGTIPANIARAPLVNLSMLGNRLSGSIPKEFGDISSLQSLVLEDNHLEGSLHPNLGKLSELQRFLLSSNNFSGTIPETFGNLKNLTDFRIDGTIIEGKIPDFIGNWTKLDRMDMQGTSLEGPIPSNISLLKNLTELRISDLSGPPRKFPNLKDLMNMERLVLRNCSITGPIPDYIGQMTKLILLDLSFNSLTGGVPGLIQGLEKLDFMFLTNNSLSGEIPGWIVESKNKLDLSYNNFSSSSASNCQIEDVNLVSSHSSSANTSLWCLKKGLPCSGKPKYHSLFINCGGHRVEFEGNEYEEDLRREGMSNFVFEDRWAYSSTGVYLGYEKADNVAKNESSLNVSSAAFYKTARLSALSLKYYGLCMLKGNYKVKLHFAEIIFSDDQTFSSIGDRIFDVFIQGTLYLKDFNIAEDAGGVGKETTKEYNVDVNGSTLEIHLYWAGKGTNAIPDRGVYGPLISAISVTPNFSIPSKGLSIGAILGIVTSSCVVLALLLVFLGVKGFLGGKDSLDSELRGLDLQTGYFTLKQVKAATGNFDPANKIGEGGFGPVYKGVLSDGTVIAVKQLSSKSKQGNREFVNEIGMISALQHPNLVKLYGCCIEEKQLLLIYEYLENNCLARALFGTKAPKLCLDWPTRKKICLGLARGLAYLHEESRLKIVHRDIKATNVLLDKNLNAKISDFGLAKLDEEENTHISTRIAGTIGYMAPEYAMRGYLTDKADVYSFGIVALEIVSGKSNTNYRPKEEFVYLLDWAYVLQEQGNLLELVDPDLGSSYSTDEAMKILNLALVCANPSPTLRPSMSSVVNMLEGKLAVQASIIKQTERSRDARFKAFELLSQDSQTNLSSSAFSVESQMQREKSMDDDGPWNESSTSLSSKEERKKYSSTNKLLSDLYDVN